MASRNLNDLTPHMKERTLEFKRICDSRGLNVLIYCTLRGFEEQAKLYRQSRTIGEINSKIYQLERLGYEKFAEIIKNVGPQNGDLGKHVTKAGPGESYHNYGLAFDAVPSVAGQLIWSSSAKEWDLFGECVREAGLFWGGDWQFQDKPHVQIGFESNPLRQYNHDEIKTLLKNLGI